MVAYKDFILRNWRASLLGGKQGQYESFDAALAAANEWIGRASVRVISVETLVFGIATEHWFRVWYETRDKPLNSGDVEI